jgi:hypothetical protein
MAAISRADKWRQVILGKLQSMQARRQQFSDLVGWRAAIKEEELSEIEKWWLKETTRFDAMLQDALAALNCLPEVKPQLDNLTISCSLPSTAVRAFAVLRFGGAILTVRSAGKLVRGRLRPVLLRRLGAAREENLLGKLFLNPPLVPSAEETQFLEQQIENRIEDYLRWVASGAAVERWERNV